MNFSNRLRHLRQKFKLTQGELAAVINLKPTAISNYESTRNEPSFEKLTWLCDYFNVSSDYMLGRTDNPLQLGMNEIDDETAEFFTLYKQLNNANIIEIRSFAKYLLYKQEETASSNETKY